MRHHDETRETVGAFVRAFLVVAIALSFAIGVYAQVVR